MVLVPLYAKQLYLFAKNIPNIACTWHFSRGENLNFFKKRFLSSIPVHFCSFPLYKAGLCWEKLYNATLYFRIRERECLSLFLMRWSSHLGRILSVLTSIYRVPTLSDIYWTDPISIMIIKLNKIESYKYPQCTLGQSNHWALFQRSN